MTSRAQATVARLLALGEIEIGGSRPFDLQVHDPRFYERVLSRGTMGLGEAFMDGWWDCAEIDEMVARLLRADIFAHVKLDLPNMVAILRARLLNPQRHYRTEVGERHYDIGNDLYQAMLDPRMVYSCGYWAAAQTLAEAQDAKLDLICRKLGLKPGQQILDIGSGWGGLMAYAAERHGVSATGITVSTRQAEYAAEKHAGLPVETRLQDWEDLTGRFDHVVSVGMFEHVGFKNYRRFFEKIASLLSDDGLFLLHTIGGNTPATYGDPWLTKYIFPHGMVPALSQIATAAEGLFVVEDVHNFGPDYDPTLMAWRARFEAAWPQLSGKYTERFRRMWRYYLLTMAGSFRARQTELYQLVFSRHGVAGGYRSQR